MCFWSTFLSIRSDQNWLYLLDPHLSVKKIFFGVVLFHIHISTRVGYDTMWIFKRSLTGLNSEFLLD